MSFPFSSLLGKDSGVSVGCVGVGGAGGVVLGAGAHKAVSSSFSTFSTLSTVSPLSRVASSSSSSSAPSSDSAKGAMATERAFEASPLISPAVPVTLCTMVISSTSSLKDLSSTLGKEGVEAVGKGVEGVRGEEFNESVDMSPMVDGESVISSEGLASSGKGDRESYSLSEGMSSDTELTLMTGAMVAVVAADDTEYDFSSPGAFLENLASSVLLSSLSCGNGEGVVEESKERWGKSSRRPRTAITPRRGSKADSRRAGGTTGGTGGPHRRSRSDTSVTATLMSEEEEHESMAELFLERGVGSRRSGPPSQGHTTATPLATAPLLAPSSPPLPLTSTLHYNTRHIITLNPNQIYAHKEGQLNDGLQC